jgi:hypothetical protein
VKTCDPRPYDESPDAVVASIGKSGGEAVAIQADVGRREEFTRLFAVAYPASAC